MACGHCLAAVRNGMAECTPNLRASYDAADTTPRSSRWPPTTTALPFSAGLNSSSTETKKASISTWKIIRRTAESVGVTTRRYTSGALGFDKFSLGYIGLTSQVNLFMEQKVSLISRQIT